MFEGFTAFTWIHTGLSLIMLVSGVVVVRGLLRADTLDAWTAVFLLSGVATSATGFGFPFDRFGDSHWVGVVSLVTLGAVILARYAFHYAESWRWVYAVGVVFAFYLDAFVLVAQFFKKLPMLKNIAPTLSEPPFLIAQAVLLAFFVWLTVAVTRKFRPKTALPA